VDLRHEHVPAAGHPSITPGYAPSFGAARPATRLAAGTGESNAPAQHAIPQRERPDRQALALPPDLLKTAPREIPLPADLDRRPRPITRRAPEPQPSNGRGGAGSCRRSGARSGRCSYVEDDSAAPAATLPHGPAERALLDDGWPRSPFVQGSALRRGAAGVSFSRNCGTLALPVVGRGRRQSTTQRMPSLVCTASPLRTFRLSRAASGAGYATMSSWLATRPATTRCQSWATAAAGLSLRNSARI
jgi:hypothetical protein